MVKLLSDRPKRRASIRAQGLTAPPKVLLILSTAWFSQYDAKMSSISAWSDVMAESTLALAYDHIVVIHRVETHEWANESVARFAQANKDRVHVINIGSMRDPAATSQLLRLLQGFGVEFHHIRNPRTVSYLNLADYCKSDNLTIVRAALSSYDLVGLTPDKEPTFTDAVKTRVKRAGWNF